MEQLPGVLLEVDAHEADGLRPGRGVDLDRAAGRDRTVELADLVPLRQVRVEVVLAGEPRVAVDLAADGVSELHRERHRAAVHDGQRSRKAEADRAGHGIGGRADRDGTGAEELRPGLELGVDLQPDDGENPRLYSCFQRGHREILTLPPLPPGEGRGEGAAGANATVDRFYNARVTGNWIEEESAGAWVFRPPDPPPGLLVAFSGRGAAPTEERSPTSYLARRFARTLAADGLPIVRATQVHGKRAVFVREAPGRDEVRDAGECDILATDLSGVALVVQTADCVPILLAGPGAVAVVARRLARLGEERRRSRRRGVAASRCRRAATFTPGSAPRSAPAATKSAAKSPRSSPANSLRALLRRPLPSWISPPSTAPSSKRPGSRARTSPPIRPARVAAARRFASYRRDGAAAGRMIALIARV